MAPPANPSRFTQGRIGHQHRQPRGDFPMNSLGLRTDSMDCLELLDPVADPTAANAMWDGWLDSPPPLFGRHPDEQEDLEDEGLDDEEDLDDEDFDDDDEDFDDEDFD